MLEVFRIFSVFQAEAAWFFRKNRPCPTCRSMSGGALEELLGVRGRMESAKWPLQRREVRSPSPKDPMCKNTFRMLEISTFVEKKTEPSKKPEAWSAAILAVLEEPLFLHRKHVHQDLLTYLEGLQVLSRKWPESFEFGFLGFQYTYISEMHGLGKRKSTHPFSGFQPRFSKLPASPPPSRTSGSNRLPSQDLSHRPIIHRRPSSSASFGQVLLALGHFRLLLVPQKRSNKPARTSNIVFSKNTSGISEKNDGSEAEVEGWTSDWAFSVQIPNT